MSPISTPYNPELLLELWWNMPPEQRDQEFLTPKQIAPQLGIGEPHVRNKADQGTLPGAIKPVGRWVVHKATVLAWLKRKNNKN